GLGGGLDPVDLSLQVLGQPAHDPLSQYQTAVGDGAELDLQFLVKLGGQVVDPRGQFAQLLRERIADDVRLANADRSGGRALGAARSAPRLASDPGQDILKALLGAAT